MRSQVYKELVTTSLSDNIDSVNTYQTTSSSLFNVHFGAIPSLTLPRLALSFCLVFVTISCLNSHLIQACVLCMFHCVKFYYTWYLCWQERLGVQTKSIVFICKALFISEFQAKIYLVIFKSI